MSFEIDWGRRERFIEFATRSVLDDVSLNLDPWLCRLEAAKSYDRRNGHDAAAVTGMTGRGRLYIGPPRRLTRGAGRPS